jgi:preprotein translocase subunit SecD
MAKTLVPLLFTLLLALSVCAGCSDTTPGTTIILEADVLRLSIPEGDDVIESTITIIKQRTDAFGIPNPTIKRQGTNQILVRLPGITDVEMAKKVVQPGYLEFREVELNKAGEIVYLKDYLEDNVTNFFDKSEMFPRIFVDNLAEGDEYGGFIAFLSKDEDALKFTDANGEAVDAATLQKYGDVASWIPARGDDGTALTGDLLSDAQPALGGIEGTEPQIEIEWNDEGALIFDQIAARLYNYSFEYSLDHVLGIFFDNNLISAPQILAQAFYGEGVISGSFTSESAEELANFLKSGVLPVPLKIVECYVDE